MGATPSLESRMTQDEIIEMAIQLGFDERLSNNWLVSGDALGRFAKMVAAKEREACAKLCEETTASWTQHLYNEGCIDCAKAIKAKGQE
jgi:hypothetical protein